MNIIKLNWKLWKHFWLQKKKLRIERHSTQTFYKTLGIAIEMCKQHPRKYYIVKVNASEWEILGSQEIRKMRKFSEAKKDNDFRKLHETAPFISPENIQRHIHEQHRRKWYIKWWNRMSGNYYMPVIKGELEMLKQIRFELDILTETKGVFLGKHLELRQYINELIEKHS